MKRSAAVFLFFLMCTFVASPAMAQSTELLRYVPASTNMVVGVNIGALNTTPVYRDALLFMKAQPSIGATIAFLETEGGLDIEKDLDAALIAMPSAPTDPNQSTMSFVIRGTFDAKRLVEASQKRYAGLSQETTGKVTRYTTPQFTFGFADDKTLVLTMGAGEFQAQTWSALGDAKKSATTNAAIQGAMAQINTTRGVWLAVNTRDMPQQGPRMNTAGLTADFVSGMKMVLVANMADAKGAKEAAKQFEVLKTQKDQPMASMLGASPLLANLKTSTKEAVMTASTSMTSAEFNVMLTRIKTMIAQGAQPPPGVAPTPTTKAASPATKGAKADFN